MKSLPDKTKQKVQITEHRYLSKKEVRQIQIAWNTLMVGLMNWSMMMIDRLLRTMKIAYEISRSSRESDIAQADEDG